MNFYSICLDEHYLICNRNNHDFTVPVNNKSDAKLMVDLLNELDKRLEYYNRVLDKCIKNERKYNVLLEDKDSKINLLKQENSILRKIIYEAEYP